jgi:hypothetical protein
MTNSSDGHASPLPDELAAALSRATDRTLNALFSLRRAVREHVYDERSHGATLAEIDAELRNMITDAAGDSAHPDYSMDRHNELTRQVLKWTESFYARQGPTS